MKLIFRESKANLSVVDLHMEIRFDGCGRHIELCGIYFYVNLPMKSICNVMLNQPFKNNGRFEGNSSFPFP